MVKDISHQETPIVLPLREQLRGQCPYGAPQLQVKARLNVNENPFSPPSDVIDAITHAVRDVLPSLNRYPDRDFAQLRHDLANYMHQESGVKIDPQHIWAANGSNELMTELLQAYGGASRDAITFVPSYSMYPEYALITGTNFHRGSREHDYHIDPHKAVEEIARVHAAVCFLASPNNPTGTAIDIDTIAYLADHCVHTGPHGSATIIVIDEAYGEFRRENVVSALTLLDSYEHLVVTRTMSKAFGAAGLRLGYLAASPRIIDHLRLVRLPYHLSALTQAAACAALTYSHGLREQVKTLRHYRDDMVVWLKAQGYTVLDTDSNFICFGQFDDTHAVFEALVRQGVLIREVGPRGFMRVSIGTEEENILFQEALCHCGPSAVPVKASEQ